SYDLSLIEAENIESIELVKNNASVYGGSSAIGGIVSITTKRGAFRSGERFSLSTEAGSFGYAKNTFTFETARETWKLRLHLANLDTDNDFPYRMPDWWGADSTAIRENNAKRQNSISASFSTRINQARILLRSDLSTFLRGLPGTVNFLEVYRNASLEGFAGRNQISVDSSFLGCEANAHLWLNLDRTLYDNTRAPLGVYLSKYRQTMRDLGLRGSLGKELPLGSGILFTTGFAGEAGARQYINSDLLGSQAELDHYARFANASLKSGLELDLGDLIWTSSAAGRYDYGDREDNFSWRLESSLRRISRLETSLGATLGTSFSLPSPYDLYWRGDSQAIGNPDLASESSRGWQFWLENRLDPFSLKVAIHHNEIENLIQWRQVQMFGNVWKPVNIGEARIQNLELEAGFQPLEWLRCTGSALFTKALDVSSLPADEAPRLMYTPELNYALRLELGWPKFSFWARHGYTGEQYSTPDNLVDPLPAYSLLDLGLSLPLKFQGWSVSPHLSVRNLLNENYSVYAYVPQPGISFTGGVTLRSPE
ncbi:MAG: TonB-dependent receptor, partial [Candidatus Syntrophosphaera sp.]